MIDWHIQEGTDCIGRGTTGESPTVNVEEHCEIIRVAVEQAAKRVPIMVVAAPTPRQKPSNWQVRQEGRRRQPAAGGALLQQAHARGQYQHFKAIVEATGDLPVVLYNVPGRSVADMLHDTVLRLAQVPGIIGIKGGHGQHRARTVADPRSAQELRSLLGDDPTAVALMLCGGHGNISVTANVAPRLMHELCVAATAAMPVAPWKSSFS